MVTCSLMDGAWHCYTTQKEQIRDQNCQYLSFSSYVIDITWLLIPLLAKITPENMRTALQSHVNHTGNTRESCNIKD